MSRSWVELRWRSIGDWARLGPGQWPPKRLQALTSDPAAASTKLEAGAGFVSRRDVIEDCDKEPLKVVMVIGVFATDDGGRLLLMPGSPRSGGGIPQRDIVDMLAREGMRCYLCRKPLGPEYQVDHVHASCNGGAHSRFNWSLTHAECNNRKNGHMSMDPQWPDLLERVYRNGSEACSRGMHCKHPDWQTMTQFCHCPEQLTWAAVDAGG